MKTNIDVLLNFIFTIAFTVLIFAVLSLSKDNKTMRAEIDELHTLFSERFLQEMLVKKPTIRDLEYHNLNSKKTFLRFEF